MCVCASVSACQRLLSSPICVVEDNKSGHCRLVVLVVDEIGEKERNSDVVSLTYHHIDIVYSHYVCLCVCVGVTVVCERTGYDSLSTCTPTPKTAPVPASPSLATSLSGWVRLVTEGAAVCLVAQTR